MKIVYDIMMLGVILWAVATGFNIPLALFGAVMIGVGFAAGCRK